MNRIGSRRISTRSWELIRQRTRRPLRRPTASWRASGTRIRTRATKQPKPSSRKLVRHTRSCPTTRIASVTTRFARWPAAERASPPDRAAREASRTSSVASTAAVLAAAAITYASRPPACPAAALVSRTSSPASSEGAAARARDLGATLTARPSVPVAMPSRRHPRPKRAGRCARSCPSPSDRPLTVRP